MLIEDFIELYAPIEMEKILFKKGDGCKNSEGINDQVRGALAEGRFTPMLTSNCNPFSPKCSKKEGRFTPMHTPNRNFFSPGWSKKNSLAP